MAVASDTVADALVVAYLLAYSTVAGVLLLVGAALDRLPVVPDVLSRRYDQFLLRTVSVLAGPADAWPAPPTNPPRDTTD